MFALNSWPVIVFVTWSLDTAWHQFLHSWQVWTTHTLSHNTLVAQCTFLGAVWARDRWSLTFSCSSCKAKMDQSRWKNCAPKNTTAQANIGCWDRNFVWVLSSPISNTWASSEESLHPSNSLVPHSYTSKNHEQISTQASCARNEQLELQY